jgi:hypothetical protein
MSPSTLFEHSLNNQSFGLHGTKEITDNNCKDVSLADFQHAQQKCSRPIKASRLMQQTDIYADLK